MVSHFPQPTVWSKRWQTLDQVMEDTYNDYTSRRTVSVEAETAVNGLLQTLNCLRAFAADQFTYFHDGFFGAAAEPAASQKYPPAYVLMTTLDQVGYDLRVLTSALNQRFSPSAEIQATLNKADALAQEALKPAAALGLDGIRAITYLQKSPSIRVIPYANVALIGAPYTAVSVPRDYLAIPHEVGHYIFWHGTFNGQTIATYLKNASVQQEAWAYRWLEEIFADLYGCHVAGPALALSFQDLQLQLPAHEVYTDDGDHPVPIIRPDIYHKGIKAAGWPSWAQTLDERWNGSAQKPAGKKPAAYEDKTSGKPAFLTPGANSTRTSVTIEAAISPLANGAGNQPLDTVITEILNLLANTAGLDFTNWWREGVDDTVNVPPQSELDDYLYDAFKVKIETNSPSQPEDPVPDITCKDWGTLRSTWSPEPIREEDDPDWLPTLMAGGWNTEGPQGNPTTD